MAERLIVISLTQMQDFDQDFIYVMIRAVTDFLAITTIHSETSQILVSGIPHPHFSRPAFRKSLRGLENVSN